MKITYSDATVRIATGGRSHDSDLPGIVLIHGAGMDRTTWQMQSRWFAHHGYRVAARAAASRSRLSRRWASGRPD